MGIRTSARRRESLYRLSDGLTDLWSDCLNGSFEMQAVWSWKSWGLWQSELRQTKGQKAWAGSLFDHWPFNLLWLHQKKLWPHLQLPHCTANVPLGHTFVSTLFVSASVENEGQVTSTHAFYCTLRSGPKHLQYPLSEVIYFFPLSRCQWQLKTGLICRMAECSLWPQ